MLNELLIAERGSRYAGIETVKRHPDVKDVGKKETLRVRLCSNGTVADVDPVPSGLRLWTLGKGNKKRFPFMQPNAPLMKCSPGAGAALESLGSLRGEKRRTYLLKLCNQSKFNNDELNDWPGVRAKNGNWSQDPDDYLQALRDRREQLGQLMHTDGASVIAAMDRFLKACGDGSGGPNLLKEIANSLIRALEMSTGDHWVDVALPLLFIGGGGLFFDVPTSEFTLLASDPRQIVLVSRALDASGNGSPPKGVCNLTGEHATLVKDTFPDLVVKVIDKTIGLKVKEEEEDVGLDITQQDRKSVV